MAKAPNKKIVVVEDDLTYLSFWQRISTEMGIEDFELFSDPKHASLFMEEVPCKLLISGIIMHYAKGYELANIAFRRNPDCNIILSTSYGTITSRFGIPGCRFHLLHKPYSDIQSLKCLIKHLIEGDNSFDDISEDSFSENEDYPHVTEWKL